MTEVQNTLILSQRVFGIIAIPTSIIASVVIFFGGILAGPLGLLVFITLLASVAPILSIVFGARTLKDGKRFGLITGIATLILVLTAAALGYGATLHKTIAVQQLKYSIASAANNEAVKVETTYSKSFSGVNCRVEVTIPKESDVLASVLDQYAQKSTAPILSGCNLRVSTGQESVSRTDPRTHWLVRMDSEVSESVQVDWHELAQWVSTNEGCAVNMHDDYSNGSTITLTCDDATARYDTLPQAVSEAFDVVDMQTVTLTR